MCKLGSEFFAELLTFLRNLETAPPTSLAAARHSTPSKPKRSRTGYQLFQDKIWKEIQEQAGSKSNCHSELKLGDISSIVGHKWSLVSPTEKEIWDEKASEYNKGLELAINPSKEMRKLVDEDKLKLPMKRNSHNSEEDSEEEDLMPKRK